MKYPQLVSMPSDVSDWLEDQLEARGIDAAVYTRYVLSLLYKDPDLDSRVTNSNKDVRRAGGGGRKRIRRSSDWWGHVDVEELKRSAAVECLMSAAEQKCGIESLVDELCAKLKEIKNNSNTVSEAAPAERPDQSKLSPQDLAKQYYEAFPPLNRNSSSPPITVLPKWFGSPKKKAKKNSSLTCNEKLHMKADSEKKNKKQAHWGGRHKRQELGHRNTKPAAKRTESMGDWNLYMFNDKMNSIDSIWPEKLGMVPNYSLETKDNNANMRSSWNDYENNLNMYNNLPLELRDLLNSPVPQEQPKKHSTPPSNTRIRKNLGLWFGDSIWSNDSSSSFDYGTSDNLYNLSKDTPRYAETLGAKLSKMSLDGKYGTWPMYEAVNENEKNVRAERQRNLFRAADVAFKYIDDLGIINWDAPTILEKWSDPDGQNQEINYQDQVIKSIGKLSTDRTCSAFAEVIPKNDDDNNGNNVEEEGFCKAPGSSRFSININKEPVIIKKECCDEKDKEDLLTSEKTHFQPINEKAESTNIGGRYIDGTTFVIPSNLDKVPYKLCENGNFFLEDENGVLCKYREYKTKFNKNLTFIPKYKVIENEMACQTDFEVIGNEKTSVGRIINDDDDNQYDESIAENLGNLDKLIGNIDDIWKPIDSAMKMDISNGDLMTRSDSVSAELFEDFVDMCENCTKNKQSWINVKNWDQINDEKYGIWDGDICRDCVLKSEKKPLSHEQSQFRQDIRRDGEQLLSDLNCWQKNMREGIRPDFPYQVSDIFRTKDIKRRHSSSSNYYGCIFLMDDHFSFASQLEHAKLSSVIPNLRSVTL